jgi:hypothetical protein
MPASNNPTETINNPLLLATAASTLRAYAAHALANEPPVSSPNAGYKAYSKRMNFARQSMANAEYYAPQAAFLLEKISNGVSNAARDANISMYLYITEQNGSGNSLFDCDADQVNNIANVGATSGKSVFDILAGVDQSDLI